MARKPRIHFPGAFYHVILRGNAGEPIFFGDSDRYRLYLILQYAVEKFHCRIHAFCLMLNHIHLLVQVEEAPLSRIMQNISLRFTSWINHTQSRTGHLFQGRYKAILLDSDAYLLELVRYIHLNPVRVGAIQNPDDFSWSGHRAYLGVETIPWLTTEFVLSVLSPKIAPARQAYASFVRDGLGEGRRAEFHCGRCEGRILGDDSFAENVLVLAQEKRERAFSLQEVIDTVCGHFQLEPETLSMPGKSRPMAKARAVAAAIVQLSPHLRLTDLAKLLNRDISALSKAARGSAEDGRQGEVVRQLLARVSEESPKLQPDPEVA